ncbi:hypothetical protein GGF46_002525 [Coemansia sp. RSA 552]|nr:hypothetical protein GGF46_002525 [Coemansia sp. RSA 552]
MVQSFNIAAFRSIGSLLLRPSLLVPQLAVSDIRSIPFDSLQRSGIRFLVFDKDNCLTAPYVNTIHPPFQDAWAQCRSIFPRQNILVVSNSAGTPDDSNYMAAREVERELGVPVLRHTDKKPRCGAEILQAFGGAPPAEIAVVGDRLATDVAMANMCGMMSIWTRDIVSRQGDNRMAALVRDAEHWVYGMLKRRQ